MKKRFFGGLIATVLALTMVFSTPVMAATTPVKAAGTTVSKTANPYADVTVKKVGKNTYDAIKYLKGKKAFDGIFTGKNFSPNKNITRRQFLMILRNLYGKKVVINYTDLKNANKPITAKWACDKMVAVGSKLGVKMKWNGSKTVTMTRASTAVYVKIFIDFDGRLKPKK